MIGSDYPTAIHRGIEFPPLKARGEGEITHPPCKRFLHNAKTFLGIKKEAVHGEVFSLEPVYAIDYPCREP